MNIKLSKLRRIAIFLAGISAASIPAMVQADWSIVALGGSVESYATGINDSGQVVGHSAFNNGSVYRAFVTGPDGVGMTDLGTLGGSSSRASAINDIGEVVGLSRHAGALSTMTMLFSLVTGV